MVLAATCKEAADTAATATVAEPPNQAAVQSSVGAVAGVGPAPRTTAALAFQLRKKLSATCAAAAARAAPATATDKRRVKQLGREVLQQPHRKVMLLQPTGTAQTPLAPLQ